jgi:hypothetical protein
MLIGVVVNKQRIASEDMEPEALKGFIGAALGYKIDDPDRFLREQQEKCFAVAAAHEAID